MPLLRAAYRPQPGGQTARENRLIGRGAGYRGRAGLLFSGRTQLLPERHKYHPLHLMFRLPLVYLTGKS